MCATLNRPSIIRSKMVAFFRLLRLFHARADVPLSCEILGDCGPAEFPEAVNKETSVNGEKSIIRCERNASNSFRGQVTRFRGESEKSPMQYSNIASAGMINVAKCPLMCILRVSILPANSWKGINIKRIKTHSPVRAQIGRAHV